MEVVSHPNACCKDNACAENEDRDASIVVQRTLPRSSLRPFAGATRRLASRALESVAAEWFSVQTGNAFIEAGSSFASVATQDVLTSSSRIVGGAFAGAAAKARALNAETLAAVTRVRGRARGLLVRGGSAE